MSGFNFFYWLHNIFIDKVIYIYSAISINIFKYISDVCVHVLFYTYTPYHIRLHIKWITYVSPSLSLDVSFSMGTIARRYMALATSLGSNTSFNLSLALTDGNFSIRHGNIVGLLSQQIGSLTTLLIISIHAKAISNYIF